MIGLVLAAIALDATAVYRTTIQYGFLSETKLVGIRSDGFNVTYTYEARRSDHARAIAEDARQELGYKTGWTYTFRDDSGEYTNSRTGESIRFASSFMGKGYQTYVEIARRATLSERIRAWLLSFTEDEPRQEW